MAWWKSPTRRVSAFYRLSPRDRGIFFRAWLLLPIISIALRFRGLQWTINRLNSKAKQTPAEPSGVRALEVERLVAMAARHGLGERTCLQRSTTLWHLLNRLGVETALRIGVRRERVAESLDAHAWVEVEGRPVNDRADIEADYSAFPNLLEAID